jgi:hypothetical protein
MGYDMKPAIRYKYLIESEYNDSPCLLGVINFTVLPGGADPWSSDSDIDCYGYREITFDILRPSKVLWKDADEAVHRNPRALGYYEDLIESELGELL